MLLAIAHIVAGVAGRLDSFMLPKKPYVVAFTLVTWLILSAANFGSFDATIPREFGVWTHLALLSFYGWFMLFWLWGLHTFAHHLLSFIPAAIQPRAGAAQPDAPVAIIYTVCDDFDPKACASALGQTHPWTRLLICDDSADPACRAAIDRWAQSQSVPVLVVRRPTRQGFKAGNLNYALAHYVEEEYVLICDADELLPPDFVERMLPYFTEECVGFVQANHRARSDASTRFAATISLSIELFFSHLLPVKNRFGYVACQGHGVIIRRSVWEKIGGFPEIICEDMGFSARALRHGYRGVFVPDVMAEEMPPLTYRALLKARTRVIQGAIQFFQTELRPLLRSPNATLTEKIDLLLTESVAYLGLIVCVSLWGGLIISYLYSLEGYNGVQPWLPFVFAFGPVAAAAPILYKIPQEPRRYGLYLFVMAANYTTLMPVLAWQAIVQTLKLRPPEFYVTGKIARQSQSPWDFAVSMPFGLALVVGAVLMSSPMSPLIICVSLTFLLTPLLYFTEQGGLWGKIGRYWGLTPYLAIIMLGFAWMHRALP